MTDGARGWTRRAAALAAGLISVASLIWASGAPLALGVRVWAEQVLIAALCLSMALVFLERSRRREARAPEAAPWPDRLLALAAAAYGGFLVWRFPYLSENLFYAREEALWTASIGLALLLEAVRRALGWPLIAILGAVCGYALFADRFPGALMSRAISPERLVRFTILDSASMAGAALSVAVIVVVPYVILARLLARSGGSAFFSDLAVALLGRMQGGSGKIAILASALFGSISGSAVANVASTGAVTIPLMARGGYRPRTAAAIEAVASTDGQLMPPIMGASAFLLAENLQVGYGTVIVAALVPALLYYVSLFIVADLEAARAGILPVEGERPGAGALLRRGWFILAPFAALVVLLFGLNLRPETAALGALALLFLISLLVTYEGPRLGPRDIREALTDGGRSAVEVILICALAGIVIGVVNLSGLSFGLTFFLVELGETSLAALLALTALLCVLLGMGLPTVGVYLLLATLAAPPLVRLGLDPMAAHLFVLYFGMLSMITPPVAIAAFVAANMAKASPMATGLEAVRVGWIAFVTPFLFVASPALLLRGENWLDNAVAPLTAAAGVFAASAGIVGWLRGPLPAPLRLGAVAAGLALLLPHPLADWVPLANAAGLAAMAALWSVAPGAAEAT